MKAPRLRSPSAALAMALLAAHGAPVAGAPPSPAAYSVRVAVDAAAPGAVLQPELFGINSTWLDAGGGIVEFGEMIRDRSFRNHAKPASRVWIESPDERGGGSISQVGQGGDDRPWGGKGYPGHLVLSRKSAGYTCVSQQTTEGTQKGARYELHVSARAEAAQAALVAFFADEKFLPIEKADRFVAVQPGRWADYAFELEPGRTDAFAMVRVCLMSPGTLAIDEVRLRRLGGEPRVKDPARQRVRELGARGLRWPAGSDADFFSWRDSVGPTRTRGENVSAFGAFQTPSWGLHEFLDFCESERLVPLITVNLREAPQQAADLVEYILGPPSSPMGRLRAGHGRAEPWSVRHFELGNEPAEAFQGEHPKADTAKGYVALAKAAGAAMRARAASLGKPIELKGALETTFAIADWIRVVPMLSRWNASVLDRDNGLVRGLDQVHGHFYSAFTWRESDREQFEEVMAGGATLAEIVRRLRRDHAPLPPFWLTEYSVLVEKKGIFLLRPNRILLERAKDFQAGLAAADLLITAIREDFGGAHLFNLAEFGTWGVIANYRDMRLRPAGHAFAMIAGLAGERRLAATVSGAKTVTVKGADGNNPGGARFETVGAVASRAGKSLQVVLLNRGYDTPERVWIDLGPLAPKRARLEQLGPAATTAVNDERADTVVPVRREVDAAAPLVVELPARTLLRVTYELP